MPSPQKEGPNYEPLEIERMEQSTVEVFRTVKQFVGYNEEADGPVKSPQLAPLSPPPFDPEVALLEEEVRVASERIQKLRVEMQEAIEEKVKEKILAKLPTAGDLEGDGGDDGVGMPALPKGADPEALKQKLADAATKMPGLKAKLEDVYEKMVKIIDSVEGDGDRADAEAPNTAERALKRLYDEPEPTNFDDTMTMDLKGMAQVHQVQKKL